MNQPITQKQESLPKTASPKMNIDFKQIPIACTMNESKDLFKCFASEDNDFISSTIKEMTNFYINLVGKNSDCTDCINADLSILNELKPQDAFEGMLLIQMISVHRIFMQLSAKGVIPNQTLECKANAFKYSSKMSQLFLNQLSALTKYRNKGQQKVKVEHVHVSDGGQAIFGNITTQKCPPEGGV